MSSTWKYKYYGTLFAIVLSIYLLLPTLLGLKEKRADLLARGQPMPWYYSLFPSEELNLGLDLRGGLYLELEVGLDEALQHQIGFLAADIKRSILKDELESVAIENIGNDTIRVEIPVDSQDYFKSSLVDKFGNKDFTISTTGNEILYSIVGGDSVNAQGGADTARKQVLDGLKAVFDTAPDVATIQNKKILAIHYKDSEVKKKIEEKLSGSEFSSVITPTKSEGVLYVKVSNEYVARLKKDIIEQAANAARNRIDRYGLAEASVSRESGDRLVVELPGIKNPDAIIDVIKKTGKLEFRLVNDTVSDVEIKKMVADKVKELSIKTPYEGVELKKLNDALKADLPEKSEILFSVKRDSVSKKVLGSEPHLVFQEAQVTGDMLENAKVETQNNQPYVAMSFNKNGTKNFGDLTENNVGKQLAIVLDSIVMSAPVIRSAILGGHAQIELGYGRFDALQKEAQDLVLILREGALPASLSVASKNLIGPSLGQDAIDAGLKSVFISSLAVIVFMLLYYRTGGLVANIALVLNMIFLFAILCLFQASITLPGLAGIALTNGMAVDANVIIFERMREERYLGHSLLQVIESGYKHAMSAIIDGHVTIFISGLVLFEFGSGPIKGFATTLMIGIVCTLFSSIVVTKMIFEWMVIGRKIQKLAF